MISSKKLLAYWAGIGVTVALANGVYDSLSKDVPERAEHEAQPYVAVSDQEAIMRQYRSCFQDKDLQLQLLAAGSSCEKLYSNPSAEMVKNAQEAMHWDYYGREIAPRIKERRSTLDGNLKLFLSAAAFAAATVFLLWCKSTLLPRLKAMKEVVRERAPSVEDVKALGANRKVRQAESDFQTLKNLHDNGLINDEMFEKRKEELKVALSANKVFQD